MVDKMNRIKQLRKENNITVKDLANEIGISQSMLSNYENGNSTPRNRDIYDRLADYFNVSTGYVMGVSDGRKQINWEKFDEHITDAQKYEIQMLDKGFDLDVLLDEKIELRIDEKPLSKEERKALSLFIEALRELRK